MRRLDAAVLQPTPVCQGLRRIGAASLLAVLAACGGGGPDTGVSPFDLSGSSSGSSSGSTSAGSSTPTAAATAQACAPTNPYRADALSATTTGTLANEKAWLKDYMGANYLWYAEMPAVAFSDAAYSDTGDVYGSLDNYFEALKTPAVTLSGKRKDQFSFTYPTKAWNDLIGAGISAGYGINWHVTQSTPPRGLRVATVEPGSPAAAAGVMRGDTLVTADGVAADVNTPAGVDTLNAALFPKTLGTAHSFVFSRSGAADLSVSLSSANVTSDPVPTVSVITSNGRKVGYIVFNDHMASAEAPLIAAINTLKAAGIDDLVLDLRYNGGGYLYLASELAYMIAGPTRTAGKVFEQLQYNDKRSADTLDPDSRMLFRSSSCLPDSRGLCAAPQDLPTLNLSRVSVLTSGSTCSASESIINGLRGVDLDVRLIGQSTCGKPYGFTAKDNCGISYFPIEFQGVNAKGFGNYADGFAATCAAADDFEHALGDAAEGQLASALYNLQNSACRSASAAGARSQAKAVSVRLGGLLRGPERQNRILLPTGR